MEKVFNASVTRENVTKEDIKSFINNSIVKFIFFDKEYADLSSDDSIHEIHKFKSKFRGNTYISVPIKIEKGEDDKYATGISVDENGTEEPTAFAVVSKHDLRDLSKEMKKQTANERIIYGKKLCYEYVDKLNKMLNNNMACLTITNRYGMVLVKENVSGSLDAINHYIADKIEDLKNRPTEII